MSSSFRSILFGSSFDTVCSFFYCYHYGCVCVVLERFPVLLIKACIFFYPL